MQMDDLRFVFRDVSEFSYPEWSVLHDFVSAWRPERSLDLGFGYGIQSLCIADAVKEGGWNGSIVAIDETWSQNRVPSLPELLERAQLSDANVNLHVSESALSWAFVEMLRNPEENRFDLICLDARKTWAIAGFNVLLAQRLLNPGGWLIINGADHEFASSWEARLEWVQRMPAAEQMTRQVNAVFELLVLPNPFFAQVRRHGKRFFAQAALEGAPECDVQFKDALYKLLWRSQRDPDFRFGLIWNTQENLGKAGSPSGTAIGQYRFRESVDDIALGQEVSHADRTIYLMRPAWDERLTRSEVQQMKARQTQQGPL